MDSAAMRDYFRKLERDSPAGAVLEAAQPALHEIDMSYRPVTLVSRTVIGERLFKIQFDKLPAEYAPGELAGRYFFLCVPGVGEKPFAIFSAADRSVIVRTVGTFTAFLEEAPIGTRILLRGPYGAPLPGFEDKTLVLIGGGTGTASLLEIAYVNRGANDLHFLLGARTRQGFFDLGLFRDIGTVQLATDDGSEGFHGTVSALLRHAIAAKFAPRRDRLVFINCGPEPMVHTCFDVERELVDPERMWGSIEYMTSCGVGICGKCASPSGSLTCIDGPFLRYNEFRPRCAGH